MLASLLDRFYPILAVKLIMTSMAAKIIAYRQSLCIDWHFLSEYDKLTDSD